MYHHYKEIDPRVVSEIKRIFYLKKRYNIDGKFALLYVEDEISLEEVSRFVRMSDRVMRVGEHYYLIIYMYVIKDSDAYKAAENLLYKIDNFFGHQNSYIALSGFDESFSVDNILNRLKMIADTTKEKSNTRVEFDDILDRV